jgi:hypothetical protein
VRRCPWFNRLYDYLPQRREGRKEKLMRIKNTKTFALFAPLRQKLINQLP